MERSKIAKVAAAKRLKPAQSTETLATEARETAFKNLTPHITTHYKTLNYARTACLHD